jgi:hypothetical protein
MQPSETKTSSYLISSTVEWVKSAGMPIYNVVGTLTITKDGRLEFKLPTNEMILSVPAALTIRKYWEGTNRMNIRAGKQLYRFQFYGSTLPPIIGGQLSETRNENASIEAWRPILEEAAKQPADNEEIITVEYSASSQNSFRPVIIFTLVSLVLLLVLFFTFGSSTVLSIGFWLLLGCSLWLSWRQNRRLMKPMPIGVIRTPPKAILPAGTRPSADYPLNAGKVFFAVFIPVLVALAVLYFIAQAAGR